MLGGDWSEPLDRDVGDEPLDGKIAAMNFRNGAGL